MTGVFAVALRRALAAVIFCFGIVFPLLFYMQTPPVAASTVCGVQDGRWCPWYYAGFFSSAWAFPVEIGLAIAGLVAAVLIYPKRRKPAVVWIAEHGADPSPRRSTGASL